MEKMQRKNRNMIAGPDLLVSEEVEDNMEEEAEVEYFQTILEF
jgi:hypothetical protein